MEKQKYIVLEDFGFNHKLYYKDEEICLTKDEVKLLRIFVRRKKIREYKTKPFRKYKTKKQ